MSEPSIFNDVLGPIMRGPSSSHVAAASRIGQLIRMGMGGDIKKVVVQLDSGGALAASYYGHGSHMGLICGLLGLRLEDPAVDRYQQLAEQQGLTLEIVMDHCNADHPNYYHITATDCFGATHVWESISVGGGMIEVQKIDGHPVHICGDYYELLVKTTHNCGAQMKALLQTFLPQACEPLESTRGELVLLHVKSTEEIPKPVLTALRDIKSAIWVSYLRPVLPIHANEAESVPFHTAKELQCYAKQSNRQMWEMATLYESLRGAISEDDVYRAMEDLLTVMQESIAQGIRGTQYADRILGPQAHLIDAYGADGGIVISRLLSRVIRNITAVMEAKSAMGVIVAAPTAGSCGCLPGTITGVAETLCLDRDTMVKGLLAAGLIGIFVARQATFSAEVAGCQAECGVASAMAAAGLVQMLGGTVQQCIDAASFALQNVTGLVCDPVANRVEVPCLGKNVMGGSNAISCASMILAGYNSVIPLDETILAMYDIGQKLPQELRCTCGGLGKTATARRIEQTLCKSGCK